MPDISNWTGTAFVYEDVTFAEDGKSMKIRIPCVTNPGWKKEDPGFFFYATIWGKSAGWAHENIRKGDTLTLSGRLSPYTYTGKRGEGTGFSLDVQQVIRVERKFGSGRDEVSEDRVPRRGAGGRTDHGDDLPSRPEPPSQHGGGSKKDDDIPF